MQNKIKLNNFNVGTFNVHGLKSNIRKEHLVKDLEQYKLDIICLQETKIVNELDINIGHSRLVNFKPNCVHYGSGFLISNKVNSSILHKEQIYDRICYLDIQLEESKILTLINVYGPTQSKVELDEKCRDEFYLKLGELIKKKKKDSKGKGMILIAGDFNSRVGSNDSDFPDGCIGPHSRGPRNDNGQTLVDFCESNGLCITNTLFQHPARHKTTWTQTKHMKKTGKVSTIFCMLDYIICQQRHRHMFTNSRSYAGTTLTSDHRLVAAKIVVSWHRMRRMKCTPTGRYNVDKIKYLKDDYEKELSTRLDGLRDEHKGKPQDLWDSAKTEMKTAAEKTVGTAERKSKTKSSNPVIESLSMKQKEQRLKINDGRIKSPDELETLKKERNQTLRDIQAEIVREEEKRLDEVINEIDNAQDSTKMFKAIRALNKTDRPSNPKVLDENNHLTSDPNKIARITKEFYKSKFYSANEENIEAFSGDPRPLINPITVEETKAAISKLNNNRTEGEDGIPSELLKYAPEELAVIITQCLNEMFETHTPLDINNSVLVSLQKPGKEIGPMKNQRPISLLTTMRKTLSIITLNRTRKDTEEFLSHTQSGFRPNRSTADVVWTHRFLAAKAQSEQIEIYITGIDMSAAFDTIKRDKILDIAKDFLQEDECRMIQFLLSNTLITPRVPGATVSETFQANIGTPQGDSLSPILFILYLEKALQNVRNVVPQDMAPSEVAYADDCDFISSKSFADIDKIEPVLGESSLFTNKDKTEYTKLKRDKDRNKETWRNSKKVGSLIGDAEDVKRRKQLASAALNKLQKLWKYKKKTKRNTKIKAYKALVKPVLLYNCSTWGLTKNERDKLDAFHRKQLKKVLNIKWPTKITNSSLYKITYEEPISITCKRARWALFGHILRRDIGIPANQAMLFYFSDLKNPGFPGAKRTTLPITLNEDLAELSIPPPHLTDHTYTVRRTFCCTEDLEELRTLAADRQAWRNIIHALCKPGKVEAGDEDMSVEVSDSQ